MLAAPMGFSLRSFLHPESWFGVTATPRPACRYLRAPHCRTEVRQNQDSRPGYRVLPPERPLRSRGLLARRYAGCSLGIAPSQGSSGIDLGWDSALPPPTRFCGTPGCPVSHVYASEYQLANALVWPGGSDTPLRVTTPQLPWHSAASPTRAMCSPCRLPSVTAWSLPAPWVNSGLPKLSGPLIGVDQTPLISSNSKIPHEKGESKENQFASPFHRSNR